MPASTGTVPRLRRSRHRPTFPATHVRQGDAGLAWRVLGTSVDARARCADAANLASHGDGRDTCRALLDAFSAANLELYGTILQDPARATATCRCIARSSFARYPRSDRHLHQRRLVPTQLLIGDCDPNASPALLDGWRDHADDVTIDRLSVAGFPPPRRHPARSPLPSEASSTVNQGARLTSIATRQRC